MEKPVLKAAEKKMGRGTEQGKERRGGGKRMEGWGPSILNGTPMI